VVPCQELFHHLSVELIEPNDAGVVVVELHSEDLEVVAAVFDRGRPKSRGAGLEVALHDPADLRVGDLGELVGEAPIAGVGVFRRCREEPELEADLLQRAESAGCDLAMVRGHRS